MKQASGIWSSCQRHIYRSRFHESKASMAGWLHISKRIAMDGWNSICKDDVVGVQARAVLLQPPLLSRVLPVCVPLRVFTFCLLFLFWSRLWTTLGSRDWEFLFSYSHHFLPHLSYKEFHIIWISDGFRGNVVVYPSHWIYCKQRYQENNWIIVVGRA